MSTIVRKMYVPLVSVLATAPLMAFAVAPNPDELKSFFTDIQGTLTGTVMPFLMVVATVFFIYALVMYIRSAGEEQEKMRNMMLWSIIALAVILSLWSLVGILSKFFGTESISPGPTT